MTACMCLEKLFCSSFTGYHHTNVNFASLRGPRGALAVKSQDSTYFNEYSLPSPTAEQLQDSRRAQGRPDVPSYRKMRAWRFAPLLLVTTRKRTPRFHDYWPSNGKPPSTCRYIRRRLNASKCQDTSEAERYRMPTFRSTEQWRSWVPFMVEVRLPHHAGVESCYKERLFLALSLFQPLISSPACSLYSTDNEDSVNSLFFPTSPRHGSAGLLAVFHLRPNRPTPRWLR